MAETLPRTVTFDDIDLGDRVQLQHTTPGGTVTTIEIVVDHFTSTGEGIADAELHEYYLQHYGTVTLVDRPQKGGPAWDSPVGSCWRENVNPLGWLFGTSQDDFAPAQAATEAAGS